MSQRFFVDGQSVTEDCLTTADDEDRVAPFYIFDIATQSHLPREYDSLDACRAVVNVLNFAYLEV